MRLQSKYVDHDSPQILSIKYIIKSLLYPFINLYYKLIYRIIPFQKQEKSIHQVSICAIFRNEAVGLREWIEYHQIVGVQHFYLYNNNSDDNYYEILSPYINHGLVTLIDWEPSPGQISAYQHWYKEFRTQTQWVCFLDLDEYICPISDNNISNWLEKRKHFPVNEMYWRMFTSSGKINHDFSTPIIEQYTICSDRLVDIGKVFYNTAFEIKKFPVDMMHRFSVTWKGLTLLPVNEYGNVEWKGLNKFKAGHSIQVNHYWGKALSLYRIKRQRGSATGLFQKSFDNFMKMERLSKCSDFTIYRYLIPLKRRLNNIEI